MLSLSIDPYFDQKLEFSLKVSIVLLPFISVRTCSDLIILATSMTTWKKGGWCIRNQESILSTFYTHVFVWNFGAKNYEAVFWVRNCLASKYCTKNALVKCWWNWWWQEGIPKLDRNWHLMWSLCAFVRTNKYTLKFAIDNKRNNLPETKCFKQSKNG